MREIKFRAWDTKQKRMFWPRVLEYAPAVGFWLLSENKFMQRSSTKFKRKVNFIEPLNSANPKSAILMQFTGLKDKNGKEIFEGDIVKSKTHYYGNEKERQTIVEWQDDIENDSFGEPMTTGYVIYGGEWEVIGNIYENKDLLV
jgi:uncharacterized phage protein (TIGR01671 family)